MFYKNVSYSVKTFHGVTFQPGEVKEVDKFINSPFMILADAKENKTDKKLPQDNQDQQKPSSEKPKKSADTKKENPESKKETPEKVEEKAE
jgi:hypothetical protein